MREEGREGGRRRGVRAGNSLLPYLSLLPFHVC